MARRQRFCIQTEQDNRINFESAGNGRSGFSASCRRLKLIGHGYWVAISQRILTAENTIKSNVPHITR
jgi:hypothetical protein